VRNLDVFAAILKDTYGTIFQDVDSFDTLRSGGMITNITGEYGYYGWQFLDYPNVAVISSSSFP